MDYKDIAQIFGALAICCSLIIYSRTDRKKLIVFKCIQDVFWLTHYALLSAFSAAATSTLCIARSVVFYRRKDTDKKSKVLLPIFLSLYALSAILTWKNVFSILPAIGSSISTVAFWMKNPRHTKLLSVLASSCTLAYNVTVAHSVSVYVGASLTILTALFSLMTQEKSKQ